MDVVVELKERLGLQRAVETGTFEGRGTRQLSAEFPEVVSIELSEPLHEAAKLSLADLDNVTLMHGNSGHQLRSVAAGDVPTLYWLDGHWCSRDNLLPAGIDDQCPVLDEIAAIAHGHPSDCVFIDDAVYFAASPPFPYDASDWPSLLELFDAMRKALRQHHITMVHNYVIAVPLAGKPCIDAFGHKVDTRSLPQRVTSRARALVKR